MTTNNSFTQHNLENNITEQPLNSNNKNSSINHNNHYKKIYYDENDIDNFDVDLYIQDRHYKLEASKIDYFPRYY